MSTNRSASNEWLRAAESEALSARLLTFASDQANEVTALEFTTFRYDQAIGTKVNAWYPRERVTREPERRGFRFPFPTAGRLLGARLRAPSCALVRTSEAARRCLGRVPRAPLQTRYVHGQSLSQTP